MKTRYLNWSITIDAPIITYVSPTETIRIEAHPQAGHSLDYRRWALEFLKTCLLSK